MTQVPAVDQEAVNLADDIAAATNAEDAAPIADGRPPLPDETASAPTPPAATGPRSIRPARAPRRGKRARTRVRDVTDPNAMELLRIYVLNDSAHQQLIGDYTAQNISASGGDVDGFIQRILAPKHGYGTYHVYGHGKTGPEFLQQVYVSDPNKPANGYGGPAGFAPSNDPTKTFQVIAEQNRADQVAADARAKAQQDREQSQLTQMMTLMGGKDGGGSSDMMGMMLMMQMNKPAPPPDNKGLERGIMELGKLIAHGQEQQRQMAMNVPLLPLPPVVPAGPTFAEQMMQLEASRPKPPTLIDQVAALAPLFAPMMQAYMTKPDAIAQMASLAQVAHSTGMVGGEKTTQADVQMAAMNARLEMMMQPGGGPEETLGLLQAFAGFMNQLKPSGEKDWIAVVDRAIDRGPEIVQSFGQLALSRQLAGGGATSQVPQQQITQKSGRKVSIPAVLVKLRTDVLALDFAAVKTVPHPDTGEPVNAHVGQITVIQLTFGAFTQLQKAGAPWSDLVGTLIETGVQEDEEGVKRALATIVYTAWGKKDDGARQFYQRMRIAWKTYADEVAQILKKTRATSAAPVEVPEGDPLAAMKDEAGEDLGEMAEEDLDSFIDDLVAGDEDLEPVSEPAPEPELELAAPSTPTETVNDIL